MPQNQGRLFQDFHVATKFWRMERIVDFPFAMERTRLVNQTPVADLSESSLLVEAAREGDRTAFGCLYDRYARMVHGILLARVPPSEVDDLVQDVFLLVLT